MTGFQLTDAGQQIGGIGAPALRAAELFEFVAAAQLALAHIGAAGKRAALAVEDRDLGLGIEVEAAQRLGQLGARPRR